MPEIIYIMQMQKARKFDEKRAKEIINTFALSPTILRAWRNRGTIPARYFQAGYNVPTKLNKKQAEIQGLIVEFFDSHPIKTKNALGNGQKFIDVRAGDYSYSVEELREIVQYITKLSLVIEKMTKPGIPFDDLMELLREFGMRTDISSHGIIPADLGSQKKSRVITFFSKKGKKSRTPISQEWLEEGMKTLKAMNIATQQIIAFANNHL